MASRLNAKEAAALTEQKALEIEARAKQDENDRKVRAAEAAKHTRLWKAQGNRLIEAALNGEMSLRVGAKLIGGDQLISLGFSIAYIDHASFSEHQTELEIKRIEQEKAKEKLILESERIRDLEIKKLQPVVDKRISEFIKLVENEDRYKNMESTRQMVVENFREKIKEYSKNISSGKSFRDTLFFRLFNSDIFVYTPINSLRPAVQALQDALHKLEQSRYNLPNVETEVNEFYSFDNYSDDINNDEERSDLILINEFTRYLEPWECSDLMVAHVSDDYYQIEWSDVDAPEDWLFENLISAYALAWLSGKNGQALLEAIESEIQNAINSASSSIQIKVEWDGEQCTCDINGKTYYYTPRSSQLSDILKILKYKTREQLLKDGISVLEISW